MGIAGIAWAAVLVIGLVAGVRLVPEAIAMPVGPVPVIPLFVLCNMVLPRPGYRQLLSRIPRWAQITAAGMFLGFVLAGVTSHGGGAGIPETWRGQYVLTRNNDHMVVDKATYDREIVHQERLMISFMGAFDVVIVALAAGALLTEEDAPR
jgi:hypothetical protein